MYTSKLSLGGTRFWTRELGSQIREKLIAEFINTKDDTLKIDFSDVEIVDFSFASELVSISISRLAGELDGKHIVLSKMNKSVEENITVALERAELCALVVDIPEGWKLIGKCSNPLYSTFKTIVELKKTDTPTLAEKLSTTVPVLNNRLRTLYELGLVKKEEASAPSGGRQYNYYSII